MIQKCNNNKKVKNIYFKKLANFVEYDSYFIQTRLYLTVLIQNFIFFSMSLPDYGIKILSTKFQKEIDGTIDLIETKSYFNFQIISSTSLRIIGVKKVSGTPGILF